MCQCKLLCWCSARRCGLTAPFSFLPGLPISMYAKYCYRKLQKVAVTGGKKVSGCAGAGGSGCLAVLCFPGPGGVSSVTLRGHC